MQWLSLQSILNCPLLKIDFPWILHRASALLWLATVLSIWSARLRRHAAAAAPGPISSSRPSRSLAWALTPTRERVRQKKEVVVSPPKMKLSSIFSSAVPLMRTSAQFSFKIFPLVQYLRIQRFLNHECLASSPKRTPKLILTSTLTTKRTRRGNDQTFSKICYFTQLGESASFFQPTPGFCPNRLVPLGMGYPPPLGVCPLLDQISSI